MPFILSSKYLEGGEGVYIRYMFLSIDITFQVMNKLQHNNYQNKYNSELLMFAIYARKIFRISSSVCMYVLNTKNI